jgi:hypothetical protein
MIPNGMHIVKPITSSVGERSVKPFSVSLRKYKAYNRPRQLDDLITGVAFSVVALITRAPVPVG